jgi:hypothetical protein
VTLPGFWDPDFESTDDQWSLTAGAQLGKIVRRYGGTVVTIGDKLWRKGYQHSDNSQVGVGNNQPTSEDYLQEGVEQLRCGMHAQYLASLPLAATLSDGGAGRLSEYQEARIGDVVASVDQAEVLMRKIQDGIRPLIIDIIEGWSKTVIEEKAQDVREALAIAQQAWSIVLQKRSESQNQDQSVVSEKRLRRSNFQYRLWQISGIHPEDIKDPNGGADPLDTVNEREAYFEAVIDKSRDLLNNYDPTSSSFVDTLSNTAFPDPLADISAVVDGRQIDIPAYSPNAPNSSELAFAALRFAKHVQSLKNLLKSISDIDRKIAIIEGKTDRINQIDRNRQIALGAIDAVIAMASFTKTGSNAFGPFVEFDPGKIAEATQAIVKRTVSAVADAAIRDAETDAVIANLIIDQEQLYAQLPEINLGIKTASLDIQRLLGETSQQLADYAYYIDVLPGDLEEWFYDPEIRFAKQAAEERYEQLVRALQQEAYILVRHLEEAWLEPYEFPAIDSLGAYKQYTTDVDGASEFPDAEAVFNGLDYARVETFLAALKDWDEFLRQNRRKGPMEKLPNQPEFPVVSEKTVSVRKHIFQLPDYQWDENQLRYVFSEELENNSIREFRALMSEAINKGRNNGVAFRLDFDLNVALMHEVVGKGTQPVFSNFDEYPDEWNRRVVRVGVKFKGPNVSQGSFTQSGFVGGRLALHGNTYRQKGAGQPEPYTPEKAFFTDLALYQHDPDSPYANKTIFSESIPIIVGSKEIVFGDSQTSRYLDEWPFNCNQWILISRADANYDNITDIELKIGYIWGHPAQFNLNF